METLKELNKKYKDVLDNMNNKKYDVESDSNDSNDSYDPFNFDPLGIILALTLDNRLDELEYIYKSDDEND
jgi:hypothetical protein